MRRQMKKKAKVSAVNLAEFEALARKRLAKDVFEALSGGSDDEVTLEENVAAFRRMSMIPRVLRDVTDRKTNTTVLGQAIAFPVLLAPIACLRRFDSEGELAVVRAAASAGTVCIVSTGACYGFEEIAKSAEGPIWLQLYAYRDKGITQSLVQRAETAGYKAICLTVDVPLSGRRERDYRNQYFYPREMLYRNLKGLGIKGLTPRLDDAQLHEISRRELTVALTWDYLDWLKSVTKLPVLLKGILATDDARRAVNSGMAGIVVSNHGGRQLDGAPASIDVLRDIVAAVDGRLEVLLDSGVRRGTDVLRALALGAKAVLIGRPYAWALAAEGEKGVSRALEMLREEFDNAMALAGCSRVSEIDASLILNR
jgi:4-hydroxymandelate oxidase